MKVVFAKSRAGNVGSKVGCGLEGQDLGMVITQTQIVLRHKGLFEAQEAPRSEKSSAAASVYLQKHADVSLSVGNFPVP